MKKYILLITIIYAVACKLPTNPDKQYSNKGQASIYNLHLNPAIGSNYQYEMINESRFEMEVNDKKVKNENKTTVGFNYAVDKDSAGNFVFAMKYDKIQIHTQNDDNEFDQDADNAALTDKPVEKLLGILKQAHIIATINPLGQVKKVDGYNELTAKILESFGNADAYTKSKAQEQWKQFIEKGVIQKGMNQLFKVFPDSAVHVGDTWKLSSGETEALGMNVVSFLTLKEMDNNLAIISVEGDIGSDNSTLDLMGQKVSANLKGKQEGEYQLDIKEGMLLKGSITAKVKGTIKMTGKEIPVDIETSVIINGKKVQ